MLPRMCSRGRRAYARVGACMQSCIGGGPGASTQAQTHRHLCRKCAASHQLRSGSLGGSRAAKSTSSTLAGAGAAYTQRPKHRHRHRTVHKRRARNNNVGRHRNWVASSTCVRQPAARAPPPPVPCPAAPRTHPRRGDPGRCAAHSLRCQTRPPGPPVFRGFTGLGCGAQASGDAGPAVAGAGAPRCLAPSKQPRDASVHHQATSVTTARLAWVLQRRDVCAVCCGSAVAGQGAPGQIPWQRRPNWEVLGHAKPGGRSFCCACRHPWLPLTTRIGLAGCA